MSRKFLFEIKGLLREISVRAVVRGRFPAARALWMNFYRVYPQRRVIC
jgi:hypothetical protein